MGLIAGYHALQAGIEVVGLAEALPECGGYKVHKDKLIRMGVPCTPRTPSSAPTATTKWKSVTIAKVDDKFQPIEGSEQSFACDSVLIAVGLEPVQRVLPKAVSSASGSSTPATPKKSPKPRLPCSQARSKDWKLPARWAPAWDRCPPNGTAPARCSKSRPGAVAEAHLPQMTHGVFPVIHCTQEIPCNPCSTICPKGLIFIDPNNIRSLPTFMGDETSCIGWKNALPSAGAGHQHVDYRKTPRIPLCPSRWSSAMR